MIELILRSLVIVFKMKLVWSRVDLLFGRKIDVGV